MLRSILIWAFIIPAFLIASMWLLPHQHPFDEMIARSVALFIAGAPLGVICGVLSWAASKAIRWL